MRIVILTCFIFLSGAANAKNYYVSAAGSNSNTGLSASTAWQTIAKVNSAFSGFAAGDSILFRCGDVFYGALTINRSGSSGKPIVISSYSTGAKPVISGFTTVSSWSLVSTGIYQAYVPAAKTSLNMVTLNGKPQALGRYPNADAANGGYLIYETFSGATSITDNQLTSTTNWKGAEAVIRKRLWVLDRCNITAHSGGTLTYTNTNGSTYTGTVNYGYFIQNDARTLDKFGEWYLNKTTKNIQMYFGTATPSTYTIKVSTIDTLININSQDYININNLAFEGANGNSIYDYSSSYINIQNCDFSNAGLGGINTRSVTNILVENCTTNNIFGTAIDMNNYGCNNTTIRGCSVKNSGTLPGMGLSNGASYQGINVSVLSNLLMEYNNIDTTGYVPIKFQGSNVTIKNNVVNYFDFIVDDAGGIYSYSSGTDANPGINYTNRVVSQNIVMNGIGAPNGRSGTKTFVSGIYMDGRTANVSIVNNTIFNMGKNGIHCNNPNSLTITGNTSFNNLNAMSVMRWANIGGVKGLTVKNNIFYIKNDSQRSFYYTNSGLNEPVTTTLDATLQALGNIDSNYYSMINPVSFITEIYGTTGGSLIQTSPASLTGWQTSYKQDQKSKLPAQVPVSYKLSSLVGSNLFTNGSFTSNITGVTTSGSNVSASWDNTAKISGGSLKISFSSPAANVYSTSLFTIGAVNKAKNYILRFSTYGSTQKGIVRAYIRKTASPYTVLSDTVVKSFETGRKDHEIFFAAPTTDAATCIAIQIEQNSGTTYIDNITFSEANATVMNIDDQLRFEYNATKVAKTITLDANYVSVDGTKYTGSVILQPYTSLILMKDTGTGTTTTPPPAATALKASATSASINCFGATTSTAVSGTGGTSPYTGTGSFSVSAGKGSFLVAPKTAVSGTYTSVYYTIGAVSSAKNYVFRFSTLRSAGSAAIRASIRQTSSPYTGLTTKQTASISTTRIDHSYLFTAPTSQTDASFYLEIEQTAGNTYIDNIAFFEATSTGELIGSNLYTANGQFENNITGIFYYSSNSNHTMTWDTTSKISATYYYTVKDADNSTSIAEVKTSQPAAPLKATVTAGVITVSGGTTTAVVTATGGTAPYSGTGSFVVGAGTYTHTVTDAKGCSYVITASITLKLLRPVNPSSSVLANSIDNAVAVSKSLKLSVFPNPTTTSFGLMVEGGTNEKVSVQVYSAEGKILYQTTGNTNNRYSFGNSFMPGVYVVKVLQGNTLQTLKLLKTN